MRVSVLVSVSAVRPPPEAQPLIDAALKLESKSDRFGEIDLVNDIEEEERKDDDAPVSSFSDENNNKNNKYLNAETELPRCAMHLYRHISKVGGTTIRFIWDKNVVMGDWEYPIIYGAKSNSGRIYYKDGKPQPRNINEENAQLDLGRWWSCEGTGRRIGRRNISRLGLCRISTV